MAAMVEDTRWRTSAKGRRYLMATLSDPSGQFMATCFDDTVAADLEEAGRSGGCGLITVELDRRAGEEQPRVTVKRIQPFEGLASSTRMNMDIEVDDVVAIAGIGALLSEARGARGEARLIAQLPNGDTATVLLGRDFLLDPELADRIATLPGVRSAQVAIATQRTLALVG
jgi:DNA polymerase-3 subunit alpha